MKNLMIGFLCVSLLLFVYACGPQPAKSPKANETTTPANSSSPATKDHAIKVKIKEMTNEPFAHFFQANGAVEAVKQAYVSPEINGQIKKIHVTEGQTVSQGQLLVSLNADIIKNSIDELKSNLDLAVTVFKKREGLWNQKIGSEVEYLQAKSTKESLESRLKALTAQLDMAEIKSPIAGIVDQINAKEGELALPGMLLLLVVNLDNVYVKADISESFVAGIHKGDMVQVSFPSYPDLAIDTPVHRLGNVIKRENRTFLLELLLKNTDNKLKPNMLAMIKIKDFACDAAIVVPSIIIKNDMTGPYVYIVEQNGNKSIAKKVYVQTDKTEGGNTMVTKGLLPGNRLIIEGYNLIKDGMEIEIEG